MLTLCLAVLAAFNKHTLSCAYKFPLLFNGEVVIIYNLNHPLWLLFTT